MKKKINSYLAIIKQIEKVRSKNNKNWMDLYRLAFAVAPTESVKIIKDSIFDKAEIYVRKAIEFVPP